MFTLKIFLVASDVWFHDRINFENVRNRFEFKNRQKLPNETINNICRFIQILSQIILVYISR